MSAFGFTCVPTTAGQAGAVLAASAHVYVSTVGQSRGQVPLPRTGAPPDNVSRTHAHIGVAKIFAAVGAHRFSVIFRFGVPKAVWEKVTKIKNKFWEGGRRKVSFFFGLEMAYV